MIERRASAALFPAALVLAALFAAPPLAAQRTGYTREEFARRRAALLAGLKEGVAVLFGDTQAPPGGHFRQDNDFFYFCGNEDLGAVLVMLPQSGETHLFLPQQSAREELMGGPNLLKDPKAAEKWGFASLRPATELDEFLSRALARARPVLHLRLAPRDTVDEARSEVGLFAGRRARLHYNDQLSADQYRTAKLRERYPQCEVRDLSPFVDALRAIKSAEEIEILRRNGRLSAEAVKQAMAAGRPGAFEYEVEAAAMGVVLRGGARGSAYAPIVGSGPNSCILHYERNDRRIEAGDLVLMDFGADLDHLAMDISRTWPASGTFTAETRELYRAVLETQKACLEAYRPGATPRDVAEHVARRLRELKIDRPGLGGGFGHGVGLSTHDVPLGGVLKEGMVFAIEPGFYDPARNIGIRVEDTVLITKDGCEVLTKDVPKEIEDIERLLRYNTASPAGKESRSR